MVAGLGHKKRSVESRCTFGAGHCSLSDNQDIPCQVASGSSSNCLSPGATRSRLWPPVQIKIPLDY